MRSVLLLPFSLISAPALAQAQSVSVPTAPAVEGQEAAGGATQDIDPAGSDIVVVASRLRGQVDAPQPPVMTLNEEEIVSYGSGSIADLVAAIAPQTGTGRGRGDGRPVFLLNGQRISSFREMRNIPPEAIRKLEVLPEEVALRFGYPPNQRVINFILKDDFASRYVDLEYRGPTRGGFAESQIQGSLLKIDGQNRINLNVEASDSSLLTEAERNVIQPAPSAPTVAGDPDPAQYRSLVADSRDLALTASWSRGLGEGGSDGSFALNGSVSREDGRSLSGLDSVVLAGPSGERALRTLLDPLTRRTRTDTIEAGATLNKPLDGWQLTVTLDGSRARTTTTIDRRADTDPLVASALAGTLPVTGPLPELAAAGTDRARAIDTSFQSLATVVGNPFRLPAGEVALTIKAGFAWDGIDSRDTRLSGVETHLKRGDVNAGLNLGLPIASRREGFLAGIGDLSANFSGGIARQSDFGWIHDWSAGLTWSPFEKLDLQASYIFNQESPSLSQLGAPVLTTFNVPVYDFTRGETALVNVISGGNPALRQETQRDLKLSANWELPFLKNSNLIVEYFRNRSSDVSAAFPVLTPQIEAAFPGRAIRDGDGRLVAIDRRPVTLEETRGSRLRYGFNLSGSIGKPQPGGRGRDGGAGAPGMGALPPGVPGMGRFMRGSGSGSGQGRWNLSLYHTVRFSEQVIVAPGGPVLDLLRGDALTGGGVARHGLELEGGTFYKGFGLRFNGGWTAPTRLRASGAPGSSDLRFGSVFDVDLRAFVNFDQQKSVLAAIPFLKGARLAIEVENLFDSRQRVTDASGTVPLSYQPDYLDPRGRIIGLDFRKTF